MLIWMRWPSFSTSMKTEQSHPFIDFLCPLCQGNSAHVYVKWTCEKTHTYSEQTHAVCHHPFWPWTLRPGHAVQLPSLRVALWFHCGCGLNKFVLFYFYWSNSTFFLCNVCVVFWWVNLIACRLLKLPESSKPFWTGYQIFIVDCNKYAMQMNKSTDICVTIGIIIFSVCKIKATGLSKKMNKMYFIIIANILNCAVNESIWIQFQVLCAWDCQREFASVMCERDMPDLDGTPRPLTCVKRHLNTLRLITPAIALKRPPWQAWPISTCTRALIYRPE